MRRFCQAAVVLCGLAAGCVMRGDTSAIEAELRGHEDRIGALQRDLQKAHDELAVAQRESAHLRDQLASAGEVALTAEQADVLFRVEGLRINTLLTGGLDEDGQPGHDVLTLVLEPFDADEQTLKLPGEIRIDVTDPAAEGESKTIGVWQYAAEDARAAWHAGLLVTGFKFRLEWPTPPRHETLVVHARLTTSDGRVFDATETVKIVPPSAERTLAATADQAP
jgi:hypothetical protein